MSVIRYDFGPLAVAVVGDPTRVTIGQIAEQIGVTRRTVHRYARGGVPDKTADRVAVAAGHLPYEVWPEYLEVSAGLRDDGGPVTDWTERRRQELERRRAEEAARRAEVARAMAELEQKERAARRERVARLYPPRPCEHCSTTFQPHAPAQRFCAMSCSEASRAARRAS